MSKHNEGIDIVKAMNILSMRSQQDGETENIDSSNDCPCCSGVKSRHDMESLREMGQEIDLVESVSGKKNDSSLAQEGDKNSSNERADNEQRMAKERFERLLTLSINDLFAVVLKAQEERTSTYLKFEKVLGEVLKSRNISQYMEIVATVTAAFSTQSNLINSAKDCFEKVHGINEVFYLVRNLQEYEKEKLNLTAALHLERLR